MDALFRVKLQIPVVPQKLASRTRIDSRLNEGLGGRLTLVTAPAGYGKTTAVAKWASQLDMPVAWFAIDSLDNSPKRFWSYFIGALENILPGLGKRFSRFLHTANNIIAASIVSSIVDEMYQCKKEFAFVLDDYHLIEDNSIHESITLLLKYLPSNANMVIISRTQLHFNSVRLQTIGHINEIRLSDLQFTPDEIAALCKVKGVYASAGEVTELEELSEGWAAGLYLLLDSADKDNMRLSRLTEKFVPERQRIAAYLSEEVVKQWGETEMSFMLKTSILQALSGPLCDALTGQKNGGDVLRRLADHNAFIIALDHEGGWYRYHHLFSDFLKKILERESAEEKNNLHGKAGTWYAREGYYAEAIGHYLQGQHYENAADIIEEKGREMLKAGVTDILVNWIGILPRELAETRPFLCLTCAWALIISNREAEAEYWVNKAEERYNFLSAKHKDEDRIRQLEVEIVAVRGYIGLKRQNIESTTNSMIRFREIVRQGSIFLLSGINFNMDGASLIGGMFGLKGHLRLVEKEYLALYENTRNFIMTPNGYIPIMMGEIFFERNRLDEAVAMLVKGIREAEDSGTIGCLVPYTITYARILKSRGDIKGAFTAVRNGEEKLRKMGGNHLAPILSAYKTRMSLETGDQEAIDSWMMRSCIGIFDNPCLQNVYEYFTLVRVLISRKEYESCLLLLNKIKLFAEKEKNMLYSLEVHILLAIVYYLQGLAQKAMAVLKHALVMGETHGYERIFIEEGVAMAALLAKFARSNFRKITVDKTTHTSDSNDISRESKRDSAGEASAVSPVYVRRLLKLTQDYCVTAKAFEREKSRNAENSANKQISLTKREKDILHLLDSELTNAEIAYTLDISINTVKVNCSNIYRKLEVRNRERAVRIARELKLVL